MTQELFARLCDEIARLIERFPESVEALEAVKWWAQEESVESKSDFCTSEK